MPRTARATQDGVCYHVFNHTTARQPVFGEAGDCWKFIELINAAQARLPLDLMAACLMPDHFHLLLRPRVGKDLGSWMQWVFTTQVRRWHAHHRTNGQLWKGRFKSFQIPQDPRLIQLMRYIESSPVRGGLTRRAENWAWGSLNWRNQTPQPVVLSQPPLPLPQEWTFLVNKLQTADDLVGLRGSVSTNNAR